MIHTSTKGEVERVKNAKKVLTMWVEDVVREMDGFITEPEGYPATVGRIAYLVANLAANTISRLQ